MKIDFKDFFTYNKRERNGIFILLSIIALLLIYLAFSDRFIDAPKNNFSAFDKEINEFQLAQKNDSDTTKEIQLSSHQQEKKSIQKLFFFDPNSATDNDWKDLGLSDKQLKIIRNYVAKGGHFYKKEDLKKIYGISEKQYLALADYIEITVPKNNFPKRDSIHFQKNNFQKQKNNFVELNSADSLQLLSLKGIGPYFAHKIIEYRNRLGGFYNTQQLLEIYHFDSARFSEIEKNISADANLIQKINLNHCTAKELKKLPYLNYNIANSIVNYRLKHGDYKQIADIQQSALVNGEVFEKIKPYLSID
ncbi:MAG: helix-hairpin-helix domain-containing protein [Bacteroidia bacterium]